MVTITVYRSSDGKPVKGARVRISWYGITNGITAEVYTDSGGEAHINTTGGRRGTIFVNGNNVFEGSISGKEIIHI